ncbi:MAG: PilZ domain-containing protein, partial [Salinibacterium sp.]|nr:PilZ domain-containing protein [Salinibacterium sp.]
MNKSADLLAKQRSFPRVSRACPINYRVIDDASTVPQALPGANGIMNNISGGGIAFTAPAEMDLGTMLALEVDLPGYPTGVISMGKVAWCSPSKEERGRFDIGVEFWWVGWKDESAQRRIGDFITDALT